MSRLLRPMPINNYISHKKKLIDKALDRYLPSLKTKPQIIHRAMRYAVFPGGKRIRPVLTVASFEACSGTGNSILPVACAIEFIHTYTLIHDDLPCMDNDDSRRGKPSCHKKFSEGLALLAGDALLTLSFQLFAETGNVELIREVSKAIGSRGTIGGQVLDIAAKKHKANRRDLDYIASHKTGALFEAAVKAGGIFKGVGRRKIEMLGSFGRDIGFIFQLIDDLTDRDGSVGIYDAPYERGNIETLSARAKSYLDIFGKKANRLIEIADIVLERQS